MAARRLSNEEVTTTCVFDDTGAFILTSDDPQRTTWFGEQLGGLLQPGDVILLEGEFGAGKTVLTQGIALGLGVTEYVTSPSFTLINQYAVQRPEGDFRLHHIDLYRVESGAEVVDLGLLDELGGEDVCVVEWAERILALAPDEHLLVRLKVLGDTLRELRFSPFGQRHGELLAGFVDRVEGA
jgi:tRNA threonylcarbamoyladenosine biosynthesis protein TsaE